MVARAAGPLISLAVTPYLIQTLGRESFGVAALALSVMTWLALVDAGLGPGLRVQLARLPLAAERERFAALTASVFRAQLATSAVAAAIGCAAAFTFPTAFGLSPELAIPARNLFTLLSLSAALTLTAQVPCAVLAGGQQLHWENAIRLISQFVRAAVLLAGLASGWGLLALGAAHLASGAVLLLLSATAASRLTGSSVWGSGAAATSEWRTCAGFGMWFTLGTAAGFLISGADRAIAARVLSLEAVATLSISGSAFLVAESMLSQIVNAARPMLGQMQAREGNQAAARLFSRWSLAVTAVAAVAACSLAGANRAFVGAWVGAEYYGGGWLDVFFAAHLVLSTFLLTHRAWLSSALIVRPQTLSRLVEGAINISLSVILAGVLGLAGILAASVSASVATSLWYLPRLTRRSIPEGACLFPSGGLARVALAAFVAAFAAFTIREHSIVSDGWPAALIGGALPLLVGGALLWLTLAPTAAPRWRPAAESLRP